VEKEKQKLQKHTSILEGFLYIHLQAGVTISISVRKLILTGFDETRKNQKNRLVFGTKFKYQILGGKPKIERFFRFIDRFLFKIQNLKE
jgi:hypothetical protein